MKKLVVIGGGPGNESLMTAAGMAAIDQADAVIADKRYMHMVKHSNAGCMGKLMETIEEIRGLLQNQSVAVIVSGDPLMYSLYKTLRKYIPEAEIEVIPGIGSMQMLAARMGESLENAVFLSGHGRALTEGKLAYTVSAHASVLMLCDQNHDSVWAAGALMSYGLNEVSLTEGSRLSYDDEVIRTGRPEKFLNFDRKDITDQTEADHQINAADQANAADQTNFPDVKKVPCHGNLSVLMIKNDHPKPIAHLPLLHDEDFIRDRTPMTKEEVRWTILGKLRLQPDAVVWDIGAGTGSVSVECARQCPFGKVYAVERSETALSLLHKNKEKFELGHMEIVPGDAVEQIVHLEMPTHVFVGGSGRELPQLLGYVNGLKQGIRVVISCVTLETLSAAGAYLEKNHIDFDMIQLGVSRGKQIGNYHILDGSNPVTIISYET